MRFFFIVLGFVFVTLATLGAFIPVLPTTPFLLLAASCFARSSTRCHNWLLNNRLLGPFIRDWQYRRCINKKAKWIAITSIVVFGGSSLWVIPNHYGQIATAILLLIGLVVVVRLKVCCE